MWTEARPEPGCAASNDNEPALRAVMVDAYIQVGGNLGWGLIQIQAITAETRAMAERKF